MRTKVKTFDCVEMKQRAQEKLRAEYQARREEFDSYSEFLAATINEDPWQRALWQKIPVRLAGQSGTAHTGE